MFGLAWDDLAVIEPVNGPTVDLPVGCGVVLAKLREETKSARTFRPDVVLAYTTLSGIRLGRWFHRARALSGVGPSWVGNLQPVFVHLDGTPWDSAFYRRRFLYPSLHHQRAAGDPALRPFTGEPGNRIEDKFWSLHCFRRGARSHVSRGGTYNNYWFRRATAIQVYEHARWRRSRASERIDVMYREWEIFDRIQLTLYSQ